jgi:hypothetical protein
MLLLLLPRRDGGLVCAGGSVVVTLDLPPRIKVRAATRGLFRSEGGAETRATVMVSSSTVDTRREAVGGMVSKGDGAVWRWQSWLVVHLQYYMLHTCTG